MATIISNQTDNFQKPSVFFEENWRREEDLSQLMEQAKVLRKQYAETLKELQKFEGIKETTDKFNVMNDGIAQPEVTLNAFEKLPLELHEDLSLFERLSFFSMLMFAFGLTLLGFLSLINLIFHF